MWLTLFLTHTNRAFYTVVKQNTAVFPPQLFTHPFTRPSMVESTCRVRQYVVARGAAGGGGGALA